MTIRRSGETGNMMAQCDICYDVVDMEPGDTFDDAREAIMMDGWQTTKSNDKWINICCDCQ